MLKLNIFPVLSFVLFLALMCFSVAVSHQQRREYTAYLQNTSTIPVKPPSSMPAQNQHSIDIAMEIFNIKIPVFATAPRFDPDLEDRGLTTGYVRETRRDVTIGAAAFTSWGVLGSTIGHEAEIHANQSFLLIVIKDMFGFSGTSDAEREAYLYEINSAERFGLDEDNLESLNKVMNFNYPIEIAQNP